MYKNVEEAIGHLYVIGLLKSIRADHVMFVAETMVSKKIPVEEIASRFPFSMEGKNQ